MRIRYIVAMVLLLLGGGAFYFFQIANQPQEGQKEESQTTKQSPESSLQLLIEEKVISPILSFDGQKVWYVNSEGRLWRFNLEIEEQAKLGSEPVGSAFREEYPLPQTLVGEVVEIIWRPDGSDFIIKQSRGGHLRYSLFDEALQRLVEYPAQISEVNFLIDDKIVYDWVRADGRHELKVADIDGSNFRKIADLLRPDYTVVAASPTEAKVLLYSNSPPRPSKIYLVDLPTGAFRDLGGFGSYASVKFSPDGQKLLAARNPTDDAEILTLVLFDLKIFTEQDLGIAGLISDFIWSADGKEVVAAVPEGLLKYDLTTAERREIYRFEKSGQFSPTNLLWHPEKDKVFFVDEGSGYLYTVELK